MRERERARERERVQPSGMVVGEAMAVKVALTSRDEVVAELGKRMQWRCGQ